MIKNKKDLKFYIKCDEIARWNHKASVFEKIIRGDMWRYNVVLRKQEYNLNCRKGILKKILKLYYEIKKRKLGYKLGWFIPPNVFGPGLCIVHVGPVIVNSAASFGSNCRIQAMVNIGASKGDVNAPHAGDFIYIGPGAKLFGKIELGSNISIGANAVVNKTMTQNNVTLAGVPASVVSIKKIRY